MFPFPSPLLMRAAPSGGDPNFSNTHLLVGCNSVNGSSLFVDESFANRGVQNNVSAPDLDTSNKVFGAGSAKFTAANLDFMGWNDSTAWSLNVDTTIEMFAYISSITTLQSLISHYNPSSNQRSWDFEYRGADATKSLSLAASSNGSTASFLFQTAWTPTANTWYYICLERSGNDFRVYQGPLAGTASMLSKTTSAFTFFDSNQQLMIGASGSGVGAVQFFGGNIDEVRYTNSVARYATDSGYAVPTAEFPRS